MAGWKLQVFSHCKGPGPSRRTHWAWSAGHWHHGPTHSLNSLFSQTSMVLPPPDPSDTFAIRPQPGRCRVQHRRVIEQPCSVDIHALLSGPTKGSYMALIHEKIPLRWQPPARERLQSHGQRELQAQLSDSQTQAAGAGPICPEARPMWGPRHRSLGDLYKPLGQKSILGSG